MQDMVDNPVCHEMRVIATNGKAFRISMTGMARMMLSWTYLWALILLSALIGFFSDLMFGIELPFVGRFLFWLANCLLVTGIWAAMFAAVVWMSRQTGRRVPVVSALFCGLSIVVVIWINYWCAVTLFDAAPADPREVWIEVVRYLVVALVLELITASFILPRFAFIRFEPIAVRPDENAAEPAQAPVDIRTARMLRLTDKALPIEGLRHLRSDQHYVEFVYADRTLLERAVLRDLVAQLSPENGIQPHRSHWVARPAISKLCRVNGDWSLMLKDGTTVPVSRARRGAVEAWLAQRDG
jgi:hypothetical protein